MENQPQKRSRLRSVRTRVIYVLGVLIVLALAGELTARFLGHRPWQETIQTISIRPEGSFYQPDSTLGYKGKAGHFDLTLNEKIQFSVTHDADGWRITTTQTQADTLPELWILGCSFTHGYGVNDKDTYAAVLQEKMPNYRVRNFAMDGYGTLQNWMTLRSELAKGRKPSVVVLAYGAFHDQRNTANRYWRKALHGQQIADGLRYPYIRLDKNDSLHIHYEQLQYHPLPLQRYFALPSLIEERWNENEDRGLRSKFVTEVLIQRIAEASHGVGAHFVLAGIYRHEETTKMLRTFHLNRLHTVDISENLGRPLLRISIDNGHPNSVAHLLMAESLYKYLTTEVLK